MTQSIYLCPRAGDKRQVIDQPYEYDSHVYVRVQAVTGRLHEYQSSEFGSPNRSQ